MLGRLAKCIEPFGLGNGLDLLVQRQRWQVLSIVAISLSTCRLDQVAKVASLLLVRHELDRISGLIPLDFIKFILQFQLVEELRRRCSKLWESLVRLGLIE